MKIVTSRNKMDRHKLDVKLNLLEQINLFSSLNIDELSSIQKKIIIKSFKKNQTILHEEDTNEFMYIILFGSVKVVQMTEDGREILLAIHRSGEFFGEISLIDKETLPATVIAIEDSSIAIISGRDFFSILKENNKILDNLLKIFCARLRESWKRIKILSFTNAEQRVKMLFMKSYSLTEEGSILNIRLTHQDIANMIGISRETVTRIIDKWRREGNIKILKNRKILLTDNFLKNL